MELEPQPTITTHPLRNSMVQFSRMRSSRSDHGILATPVEDAFLLTLELKALPEVNIWLDGRHHLKKKKKTGNFSFVDLSVETSLEMNFAFDSVEMHFPRSVLNLIAAEMKRGEITSLNLPNLAGSTDDAVMQNLARCLLPAFEHPERANGLFVDHVAVAVLTHMVQSYGIGTVPKPARGGLAPWQVRRSKEILFARLDGDITLDELARECGLSRSHFARAFKTTTGKPPHRWLMEKRLERAQELLLNSILSLAEIADACGFADQSHFTRSFSVAMGIVPSEWRRRRKL